MRGSWVVVAFLMVLGLALLAPGCLPVVADVPEVVSFEGFAKKCARTCESGDAGRELCTVAIDSYSAAEVEALWGAYFARPDVDGFVIDTYDPQISHGVDLYRLDYCSTDTDGSPARASALLAIPDVDKRTELGTLIYWHGTEVWRQGGPSNALGAFDGPTAWQLFAGSGQFVAVLPDGSGFGQSGIERHRYFDPETAASHGLDLETALESSKPYKKLKNADDIYIGGFSEGAQQALAHVRAREDQGQVTAGVFLLAGVYDVERWALELVAVEDNNWLMLYLADLVVAAHDQGVLDVSDALAEPYAGVALDLYSGAYTFDEVAAELPGSAAELLTPDFLASLSDPAAPFRAWLASLSVLDFCPEGPVVMIASEDDEEVSYASSLDAFTSWTACPGQLTYLPVQGADHLTTWHEGLPVVRDAYGHAPECL